MTDQFTDDDCEGVYDEYLKKPLAFKDTFLKSKPFTKEQSDIFKGLFKNQRSIISSCHNFGKTFIMANAFHTAMNIYAPEVIIITTAPTYRQVKSVLWAEIRRIFKNANADGVVLDGKMNLTEYILGDKWYGIGFSPRKSNEGDNSVFQGAHERTLIIIFDEATGIPKKLWDDAEGMLTHAGNVFFWAIGNPTDTSAEFYRKSTTFGWKYTKVTCFDTPNLQANNIRSLKDIRREANKIRKMNTDKQRLDYLGRYKVVNPYLLSTRWVIEKYLDWGEQSPLFQSKVIGEFPISTKNTLVPLKRMREITLGRSFTEKGKVIWESEAQGFAYWNGDETIYVGIDVAREGDDRSVIFAMQGNREIFKKEYPKTYIDTKKGTKLLENSNYLAGEVITNIVDPNPTTNIKVNVDTTGGYGDGVYDALDDNQRLMDDVFFSVYRTNFAENATAVEKYTNRVSEIWIDTAKDIMSDEGLLLEPDDDIVSEITTRIKDYDNKQRERIEAKDGFKKRIGRSPDKSDAVALANSLRHGAGHKARGSWSSLKKREAEKEAQTKGRTINGVYIRK